MRIVTIVVCIVSALAAACLGCSLAAPYFAELTWSTSTNSAKYKMGPLISDHNDEKWKFHLEWCSTFSNTAKTLCEDDLQYVMLAMSILLFIGFCLLVAIAILVWFVPVAAFWVAPFAFTFAVVSIFGIVYRVLPVMRDVLQSFDSTSTVDWDYQATGFVGFGGVLVALSASLITMIFNRKMVAEKAVAQEESKREAEEKALHAAANDPTTANSPHSLDATIPPQHSSPAPQSQSEDQHRSHGPSSLASREPVSTSPPPRGRVVSPNQRTPTSHQHGFGPGSSRPSLPTRRP